jgi:hypothetical protein
VEQRQRAALVGSNDGTHGIGLILEQDTVDRDGVVGTGRILPAPAYPSPLLTPISHRHYQSSMTNLTSLTVNELHRIVAIKEHIEKLQGEIASIAGDGGEIPVPFKATRRRMSAAARARIAAGQRARWARVKAAKDDAAPKKRRKMSAAAKAKLAAAARARWKKAIAPGKKRL